MKSAVQHERFRSNRGYRRKKQKQKYGHVKETHVEPEVPIFQGPPLDLEQALEKITPFDLFSSYHLGLTTNNQYRLVSIREVARRYNTDVAVIETLLSRYSLDNDTLIRSKFELDMARLDMEVVPEGISRREIARQLYSDYCDSLG